jgi:hypothetical protein
MVGHHLVLGLAANRRVQAGLPKDKNLKDKVRKLVTDPSDRVFCSLRLRRMTVC